MEPATKPKRLLSFHTVFILNENINWLEEFIIYNKAIGIEYFYLYDNDGSDGFDGSQTHNKYGFSLTTSNRHEDIIKLVAILKKYADCVTYVKWQPRENGKIVYGQNDSIQHFIKNYGHETEWVAFMDLDEFLFSPTDLDIPAYLKQVGKDVSCLKLIQKKFIDRFLSKEKYITQDYRAINNINIGTEWAPKHIVRCADFVSLLGIHQIYCKNKTVLVDKNQLRFNHYNVNDKLLAWLVTFYNKEYTIDGVDEGMARYKHLFTC